jgi:hypothetical protein
MKKNVSTSKTKPIDFSSADILPKRLYNYKEAALYLTLKNEGSLRNMISNGEGPVPTYIGCKVRFTRESLDKYIDENTHRAA